MLYNTKRITFVKELITKLYINMKNSEITKAFLLNIDTKTANLIVNNIAEHYKITTNEVFDEIYDEEAENLIDYVTSEIRPVVNLFFNQFKKKLHTQTKTQKILIKCN